MRNRAKNFFSPGPFILKKISMERINALIKKLYRKRFLVHSYAVHQKSMENSMLDLMGTPAKRGFLQVKWAWGYSVASSPLYFQARGANWRLSEGAVARLRRIRACFTRGLNPSEAELAGKNKLDLLPFYAILRSIPDKLGGVIAMLGAILILLILPFFHVSLVRSSYFRPLWKILFWVFAANFVLLGWIGGNPVEYPFVTIGQVLTAAYFMYFIALVPLFSFLDNVFLFIGLKGKE